MTVPLMEIRHLCKSYVNEGVETPVLFDINLVIGKGEFVAIMGPSGSGKSTLMHILGFLDTQTEGSYLFQGREVGRMDDEELSRIRATKVSFVFQEFHLLPETTVLENVLLPLLYHPDVPVSDRLRRAIRAIERVDLSDRKDFLSSQLSGGQKQRVAIARSLVTGPEVIFADEPTGNLDSVSGEVVMQSFQGLHQSGHTIILVTHNAEVAAHAERLIEIRDGRIQSDTSKSPETNIRNQNGFQIAIANSQTNISPSMVSDF